MEHMEKDSLCETVFHMISFLKTIILKKVSDWEDNNIKLKLFLISDTCWQNGLYNLNQVVIGKFQNIKMVNQRFSLGVQNKTTGYFLNRH